jgi:PAS domain S-box-containing protein
MRQSIQVLFVGDLATIEAAITALEAEYNLINCLIAPTPAGGLEYIADRAINCVVSAGDLSNRDSIEFLEAVRERSPNLPFILYPANSSEALASAAISAGVTDYVPQTAEPDQAAELASRIVSIVESDSSQQASTERVQRIRQHDQIVKSIREAACICDFEGQFEIVNESLAAWYDTKPAALKGESSLLVERITEESNGDSYQALIDGDREELTGEVEVEFPNHGFTVVEYQLTPLKVGDHIDGVVCIAQNITNQKRCERDLRQFKRAVDEAPTGITITDSSQADNPIVYANERFQQLTGYPEAEIVGRNNRFLQGENTRSEPVDTLREAIDANECVAVELRNYRADGSEFWNQVSIAPICSNGSVINYVGIQQDITERKRIEQELKRRNERLEQFSSIVSHDLRNPLNVASGRMELLEQEVDSEHFDPIRRAHTRMESLIEDLLELARQGEVVDDPEPVDLATLAEACWDTVDTVDAILRTDIDRTVRADQTRLKQVFENLFRNSVEHVGTDVTITVGELDDGFYIEDDGSGIPADARETVFESGYSTTDGGTGFGLSIVEQTVTAHGWELQITESVDGGARFEITGVETSPE